MFQILTPDDFTTSPWKNGGGVTHEIAREGAGEGPGGAWRWRLSIAEVASDGPFSRFEGMARILTVIAGAGLILQMPERAIEALPLQPVAFSGDTPLTSRMISGPIRDFNVIYDPVRVDASVEVLRGPCRRGVGAGQVGVLCLAGRVVVVGQVLAQGGFALGFATASSDEIVLPEGAICAVVRLVLRD